MPVLARHQQPAVHHRWLWRTLTAASSALRIQTDGFLEAVDEGVYRALPHGPMRCRGQASYKRYGVDEAEWAALQPMKELAECAGELQKIESVRARSRPQCLRRGRC